MYKITIDLIGLFVHLAKVLQITKNGLTNEQNNIIICIQTKEKKKERVI